MSLFLAEFDVGPANLYHRLLKLAIPHRSKVVLATLNYDLLVELAADDAKVTIRYAGLHDSMEGVSLLKLHGSVNFLPDLGRSTIRGVKLGRSRRIVSAPARAASKPETIRFCRTEDTLAPAVALYAAGKEVLYSEVIVQQQQEEFRREVSRAAEVCLIGVRVNPTDTHIWEPLSAARARISYVGFEPSSFTDWARAASRTTDQVLAQSFEEAIIALEAGALPFSRGHDA
jgi:hypothetical protein